MKITLIRHGMTLGNLEKRYIGRTDETLCPEGIAKLEEMKIEKSEILISSPMKRCIETAEILFPRQSFEICDNMRESDFGDFERKTSEELSSDKRYQESTAMAKWSFRTANCLQISVTDAVLHSNR